MRFDYSKWQGPRPEDFIWASGIEDMRIENARALADGSTQYAEANGMSGTSSATAPTDWDDVHAVRIWLLARNTSLAPKCS